MKAYFRALGWLVAVSVLSVGLVAQTSSTSRYDSVIQAKVTKQLASKNQFHNVQAQVEDGIVTLTGSVDVYQQKLNAAKKIRKTENLQGVRNLIAVNGKSVPDAELTAQLDRKLYYDRMGLDNLFNFITASVENGVATLNGEARNQTDRDSAVSLANDMAGVKDVVSNINVAPASIFDDGIRNRVAQAIYRNPVLTRYAIDPARPIRIVVDRGQLSLYGMVSNAADKQIAGMLAGEVSGAFSVQNNLQVANKS
jgi:hyperosmotically inducible periplasmic protein